MKNIFFESGIFIVTLALGYFLKRVGVFRTEDKKIISNLIMYVTLPALLINSFSDFRMDFWFIISFILGIACNAYMVLQAYLVTSRRSREIRAIYMINGAGFNLGNITMPFLQVFLPGAIPYLCMFDVADSIFSLGGTYALASAQLGRDDRVRPGKIIKGLVSSVPFDVYCIMALLSLLKIDLPDPFLMLTEFIGKANPCLAMLMLGIALEFHIDKSTLKDVLQLLVLRLGAAILFAFVIYCLIPAPLAMRQILAVSVFSAVPNICVVFSNKLGIDASAANALNPISMLLSLPLMSIAIYIVMAV